ncbi:MAG: glycosyltransferase 87 family protein [Propionibacteriales bacterium]|nr:glycosyltransferase 87 family protein [Propionibacteriales bacterium]
MSRPTHQDPVATALSEVVGGPAGKRARPHPWWTPVRVILAVFTVVFGLAVLQKAPCGASDWSDTALRYRAMCYSDVPYLYTGRGFAEHRWPYGDNARTYTTTGDDGVAVPESYETMEYPVLTSYFVWGASLLTAVVPSGPSQEVRQNTSIGALWSLPGMAREVNTNFLITAILLFCCGLGAMYFLSGASPGRPWDAMAMAASPTLLVTGLVNWDLLAVLFTAGALWAWARGRPVLAGVMVGLGVAAKLYPLFLLGAFLVDAIRRRKLDRFGLAALATAASWLVVNLPAIADNANAWKLFWSFNSDRGADLGSFWLVIAQNGTTVTPHTINVVSAVFFALACAAVFALGLAAKKRPQVAQVAFLVVAAFLLVNKVYSPQYVLWLLPLAVLARPRWRDLLIWQACELFYFGAVWLYLGGWLAPAGGDVSTTYHLAIVVRMAGEIYLMILVATDVWTAESDETEWSPEEWAEVEALGDVDRVALADVDGVDGGRREPHPDVDRAPDLGHLDPGR